MPINYPVSERTPGFIPPARVQQGFQQGVGRATNPPSLTPPNIANQNPQQRNLTPQEWAVGKSAEEIAHHITRDLGGLENMPPQDAQVWQQLFAGAQTPATGAPMVGPRPGETNADRAERLNLPKTSTAIKRAVAGMDLPEGKDRYVIEVADEAIQTSLDGVLMSGDPNAIRELSSTPLPPNSKAGRTAEDILDRFSRFEADMASVSNWLLAAPVVYGSDMPKDVAKGLREELSPGGWAALRGAAMARLMMLPVGSSKPTVVDRSEAMLRSINGRGNGVASVLFSVDERSLMKRYANTVRINTLPDGSLSPDGEQKLQPILRQLNGMVTRGIPQTA